MENVSMTALFSLLLKVYHSKQAKIKLIDDEIAEKLLSKEEYEAISKNLIQGVKFFEPSFSGSDEDALDLVVNKHLLPSVLARTIFVHKSLERNKIFGLDQYLIFASGYDTFAYSNHNFKCYEIDRDEMIEDKKRRLKQANIDCENVEFVKCDIAKNGLVEKLKGSDVDFSQKVFCSFLGISYYLDKARFFKIFEELSRVLKKGSVIVFDYPSENTFETSEIKKLAGGANEEMKSNFTLEEIELELQNYGLLVYENLDGEDATHQFFEQANKFEKNKLIAPKNVGYCLTTKQ